MVVGSRRAQSTLGRSGKLWEANFDPKAAAGSGYWADCGAMGVGDRLDDGKPEPHPISSAVWSGAKLLEGLKQASDLTRWDLWPGVRDREDGAVRGGVRGELEPAVRDVVKDGVLYQVHREALDQGGVADRDRWPKGYDEP
jgi:hypothetical protein